MRRLYGEDLSEVRQGNPSNTEKPTDQSTIGGERGTGSSSSSSSTNKNSLIPDIFGMAVSARVHATAVRSSVLQQMHVTT